MRNITVSTDVFAALWASRQPGEDSENAILERLLGLPEGPPLPSPGPLFRGGRHGQGGPGDGSIFVRMFNVRFPPGFEIFRTYKGRDYLAVVRDGRWIMDGENFPSLFALSMAIIDSRENPWMHWKYRDENGRVDTISGLRKIPPELEEPAPPRENQSTVQKKNKPKNTSRKKPRH